MRTANILAIALAIGTLMGAGANAALADDPCAGFKWDVRKERALFAGSAAPLSAGRDARSAPPVAQGRLYRLRLKPREEVAFAAPPGNRRAADAPFAGLAAFRIGAPGTYRIAVDAATWIDVVANGKLVPAANFQGQHGCNAPHKIVEFELAAPRKFVLQFSDAADPDVRVTITQPVALKP